MSVIVSSVAMFCLAILLLAAAAVFGALGIFVVVRAMFDFASPLMTVALSDRK